METIRAAERAEAAYERKMYRYKAQYSLDCSNYIVLCLLVDFFLRLRFHFLDHLRSVNLHIFFHGL